MWSTLYFDTIAYITKNTHRARLYILIIFKNIVRNRISSHTFFFRTAGYRLFILIISAWTIECIHLHCTFEFYVGYAPNIFDFLFQIVVKICHVLKFVIHNLFSKWNFFSFINYLLQLTQNIVQNLSFQINKPLNVPLKIFDTASNEVERRHKWKHN